MKKGSMLVGYQPHGKKVNFFRQVVTNPAVTRNDLDFFLDEIERLGRDLQIVYNTDWKNYVYGSKADIILLPITVHHS